MSLTASLLRIRNFLGHVSVQSTEVYARIGQAALVKMLSERGKPCEQAATTDEKHALEKYPKFLQRARR